ncbi:cytochrome P450 [Rhodococcus sp. UFZ-B548]|uniref:cytochrome P450 n=1 Tax=Rhodococcus sp. UFZ-B548 TaxID=2742212 RepID=UPI0015F43E40|nr:cytochrome P450 [Rhodococcus sp. UFZ-B548]
MNSTTAADTEPKSNLHVSDEARGFSFFRGDFQDNPGASLEWARKEEPAFYNPDSDYWVITRYEDVKSIHNDFNSYSAANTLAPLTPLSSEAIEKLQEYQFAPIAALVDADPPLHRKIRRLNAPVFMPENVNRLEGYIRATITEHIDRFVESGHADLIADLLWDVPCLVALQFLGIPEEDVDTVRKLATSLTEFGWGQPGHDEQVRAAEHMGQFWEMGGRVIAKLKELQDPPGWLGHTIKLQREYPDVFTDSWLQTIVMGGTAAAHETTTNATANAVVTLLRNRGQWERLCEDPALIPTAIEECLRHSSSVTAWRRLSKVDTEVSGVTIPAGSKILTVIASAHYDTDVFDQPEVFDIDRDNVDSHIAFGSGSHTCLGNHLARLEMRVFLEELTRRLPHMQLDDQVLTYLPNTSFRGPEALHVSWTTSGSLRS